MISLILEQTAHKLSLFPWSLFLVIIIPSVIIMGVLKVITYMLKENL